MCDLAGIVGVDPDPRTLRELQRMADARCEIADHLAWNRTFALLAQIYNANRPARSSPIDVMKFYPYKFRHAKPLPPTPTQLKLLEQIFPYKGPPS
jgi:hypothetical protein